jgi:radical SAM superfamily enzyme YgiQ (UPF0313 family)
MFFDYKYTDPVFRPPSEAYSFIIQIMNGCSQNTCLFCGMYKTKRLFVNPIEKIKKDISSLPSEFRLSVKKIFLADGDALYAEKKYIFELLDIIKVFFPNTNRISAYATANSILEFTSDDILYMHSKKLRLFYLGLESGSQKLLDYVKKGNTVEQFIKACEIIHKGKSKISVTAILGLGGKFFTKEHALETAYAVNKCFPEYFSLLTLIYGGNDKYIQSIELLSRREIFIEMYNIIENIDINTIFRSNHASNIININGTLQKDKSAMLETLKGIIHRTQNIKEYNMPPSFDDERGY